MYTSLLVGFLRLFFRSPQNHRRLKYFTVSFVSGRDKLLTAAYTEAKQTYYSVHELISGPIQYLLFTTLRFHDFYVLAKIYSKHSKITSVNVCVRLHLNLSACFEKIKHKVINYFLFGIIVYAISMIIRHFVHFNGLLML